MLVCREAGLKPRLRNIIKSAKAKLWDLVTCIKEYWGVRFSFVKKYLLTYVSCSSCSEMHTCCLRPLVEK